MESCIIYKTTSDEYIIVSQCETSACDNTLVANINGVVKSFKAFVKDINMEKKLEYSFDDEPVSKFCYDWDTKKIEVSFKRYYDVIKDTYIETSCIWNIENWEYAGSKIGDDQKLYDLNKHIGIFSLILYVKYNDDDELEMLVNTVDNRYVTFLFREPKLTLK